jgi:hypothetical protein
MSAERVPSPSQTTPDVPPPRANAYYGRHGIAVGGRTNRTPSRPARVDQNLYSIVLIDVAGSAFRDGMGQRRMRDDLYGLVAGIAGDNGFDLDSMPYDDIGDGLRLVIPLNLIGPTRVIDAFVSGLAAGLREHRRHVSPQARIRMRVCFDLGLVEPHRKSWTGYPLVRAARLVNALPVREALVANPEVDLVAVVSDVMYESVVRHRFGPIPPDSYQEIRVQVKEFDGPAWLLVPGPLAYAGAL